MMALVAQANGPGGGTLGLMFPLILMGGLFYFLLIRPQQRRARQQRELVQSLRVGDEVMTASGIFGTVREIDEDQNTLTLEISPGTNVRMVREAIARRLTGEEPAEGG